MSDIWLAVTFSGLTCNEQCQLKTGFELADVLVSPAGLQLDEMPEDGVTIDGLPPSLADQGSKFHVRQEEAYAFRHALDAHKEMERVKSSDLARQGSMQQNGSKKSAEP